MNNKNLYALGLGLLGLGGASLLAGGDAGQPAPSAGFKPVASVESLMLGQDDAFQKLGKLLGDKSAKDRDELIHHYAELLAELGNVNTLNNEKADYKGWATTIRDTALELSKEAKKGKSADETKMANLHKKLDATCQACHDQYR